MEICIYKDFLQNKYLVITNSFWLFIVLLQGFTAFVCLFGGIDSKGIPGVCGGQRTTCGHQFSPSIMWVPGIELRLSGLVGRIFNPLSPLTVLWLNCLSRTLPHSFLFSVCTPGLTYWKLEEKDMYHSLPETLEKTFAPSPAERPLSQVVQVPYGCPGACVLWL